VEARCLGLGSVEVVVVVLLLVGKAVGLVNEFEK
jgi:hypothetical protein